MPGTTPTFDLTVEELARGDGTFHGRTKFNRIGFFNSGRH
jgi:hypothetical protein